MRCRICSGLLERRITDLPFKTADSSIVIFKSLPVLHAGNARTSSWSMRRCGRWIVFWFGTGTAAELEVIRFSA